MGKHRLRIISAFIICALVISYSDSVYATTISEIEDEISDIEKKKDQLKQEQSDNKSHLSGANSKISNITGAMDTLNSEMEDLDAEMVAILTDISIIELAISDKQAEIEETEILYEEAVAEERSQYESMKIRIKYLYEKGDSTYVKLLLESKSMSDALNKADYVARLYEYDRRLLIEYQETVKRVEEVQEELQNQKAELLISKIELKEQTAILEDILKQKKQEYEDYDVQLAKAKQEAAVYTAKINQQTNEIKALEQKKKKKKAEQEKLIKEEEERKKAEEEAKRKAEEGEKDDSDSESDTSDDKKEDDSSDKSKSDDSSDKKKKDDIPAPSSGGGKGQDIVNYAKKFIGNPYVAGGTSLTNGADCSGFTMAVFKAFGISLPRTSYAQSQVGKAVSYDQARAGDLIYYGGHVGIYTGNGTIVHASTQRTGITVTSATYRPIITIRRVI